MMGAAATVTLLLLATADAVALAEKPWMNRADPPAARAKALLAKMTQAEKLVMLHGPVAPMPCCECHNASGIIHAACAYTGNVLKNERLGIPPINMQLGENNGKELSSSFQVENFQTKYIYFPF